MVQVRSPALRMHRRLILIAQMPYSDDVRSYNFPSLKHLVNKAGKVLEEHKNLPTKAMDDVMRAFIQKNDLETAGRDEDGCALHPFSPEAVR